MCPPPSTEPCNTQYTTPYNATQRYFAPSWPAHGCSSTTYMRHSNVCDSFTLPAREPLLAAIPPSGLIALIPALGSCCVDDLSLPQECEIIYGTTWLYICSLSPPLIVWGRHHVWPCARAQAARDTLSHCPLLSFVCLLVCLVPHLSSLFKNTHGNPVVTLTGHTQSSMSNKLQARYIHPS